MTAITFHPLANVFPLIDGPEFDDLVEDIKVRGQHEDIVLLDGMVLDGRNRYRACAAAGVAPRVIAFQPEVQGDPLAFVISRNLKRRHLNDDQRRVVAAKIANLGRGRPEGNTATCGISRSEAARLVNVDEAGTERARTVIAKGALSLVRAVERGKLSVSQAAIAARLTRQQQEAIAEAAEAGRASVVRSVIKRDARAVREAELGKAQAASNLNLPNKRYGVILADPEWEHITWSDVTGIDRAAINHYPVTPTDEIAGRPVEDIAASNCVLFLWATQALLLNALRVMEAWGFAYKSHFVWHKTYPGEQSGLGYWNRSTHELLLTGTRGKIPAPAPGDQWKSLIAAEVRGHSVKPDWQYELIESYFPTLPKIELNARRLRPGWDSWGLDVPKAEALPPLDPIREKRGDTVDDVHPIPDFPDRRGQSEAAFADHKLYSRT